MAVQSSVTLPRRTIALVFGVTAALSLAGAAAALPRSGASKPPTARPAQLVQE